MALPNIPRRVLLFLVCFFLLTFVLRFNTALSTPFFSSDDAYFHLRQIEHLLQFHQPLFFDELSFGGRIILYPPLFHFLLGLLTFGNTLLLKLLPELFFSSFVFVAYLLCFELTRHPWASAWGAVFATFVPALFSTSVNAISLYTLFLPLFFLLLWSTLQLTTPAMIPSFVFLTFVVGLLSPLSLLFVLTVFLYLFFLYAERQEVAFQAREAFLFSVLFIILALFLIYKRAFLTYGVAALSANLPVTILENTFRPLTAASLLSGIGLLPLLLGIAGLYLGIFFLRHRAALLLGSLVLSLFLLLSLRLISFSVGLLFFGPALGILSSIALSSLFSYLPRLRTSFFARYQQVLLFALFFVLAFLPTYAAVQSVPVLDAALVSDLRSLALTSDEKDVLAGSVYEGNTLAYFAERPTVLDSSFLLAPQVQERSEDIATLYTTKSVSQALEIIELYSIDYIFVTPQVKALYGVSTLPVAAIDPTCFVQEETYYEVRC